MKPKHVRRLRSVLPQLVVFMKTAKGGRKIARMARNAETRTMVCGC
jgi:hypothetical protein